MDKFIVRTKRQSVVLNSGSSHNLNESQNSDEGVGESIEKRPRTEMMKLFEEDIITDPALRKPIGDFDPRIREEVRKRYVLKGPCQPLLPHFPKSLFGNQPRTFHDSWFKKWEWLEYSVYSDAAFCFWCYLFRGDNHKKFGHGVFIKKGFRNWKKASEKFKEHVGVQGSAHNNARILYFAFKDQMQRVTQKLFFVKQVLDVVRLLLGQGLSFGGNGRGNFLELLYWYSLHNPELKKVLEEDAVANNHLTSARIQDQLMCACASETKKAIISDIGDKLFSLLIGEVRDSLVKEHMTIVLRYVSNLGEVVERFLGIVHVSDTTTLSLNSEIDHFFAEHGLSVSRIRGLGYDGTSNMRGELNELMTLILNENQCAKYVHCFGHQLQSVVVAVASENKWVGIFFGYLSMITNTVGSSCKSEDVLQQQQHEQLVECLEYGEISTERRRTPETSLALLHVTHWGSQYKAICRLLSMWSSIIQVLENVYYDGLESNDQVTASMVLKNMEKYEFVFAAYLMKLILGMTNCLSELLQQKEQNILEVVSLVENTNRQLQEFRESGWDKLLEDVNYFCAKNDISIPNMEDNFPCPIRSRRNEHAITYYYCLRVEIFDQVVDHISMEMENRFSKSTLELLQCLSCLDPRNSFSNFNILKLLRLAELYPQDFSLEDREELKDQLKTWICEMRGNPKFSQLQTIGALAKKMVEVGYHTCFHLVYLLIELTLILPVAPADVERALSSMNIIKTYFGKKAEDDFLCEQSYFGNKVEDDFLSERSVCFVEKDVFRGVDDEVIIQHILTDGYNLPTA